MKVAKKLKTTEGSFRFPIDIYETIDQGRSVRTLSNISQGEEILVDFPISIAVNSMFNHKNCFWCGHEGALTSCSCCSKLFCLDGENCLHQHLSSGECSLHRTYLVQEDCEISIQGILAIRCLYLIASQHSSSISSRKLEELVGNESDCDEIRLQIATAVNLAASTASIESPILSSYISEVSLAQMLGKIHRNCFKFGPGIALFPLASYINHSCAPNLVMTVEFVSIDSLHKMKEEGEEAGKESTLSQPSKPSRSVLTASVRSLYPLPANTELSLSYLPLSLLPSPYRQQALLQRHSFLCLCPPCQGIPSPDLPFGPSTDCDEDYYCDGLSSQKETGTEISTFGETHQGGDEREDNVIPSVDEVLFGMSLSPDCLSLLASQGQEEEGEADQEVDIGSLLAPILEEMEEIEGKFMEMDLPITCSDGTATPVGDREATLLEIQQQLTESLVVQMNSLALDPCHFLRMKQLVLLTELGYLQNDHPSVVSYSSEWLSRLLSSDHALQAVCDPHLKLRMMVLKAEALYNLRETPSKEPRKAIQSLIKARNLAAIIYGPNYTLVNNLNRKISELNGR